MGAPTNLSLYRKNASTAPDLTSTVLAATTVPDLITRAAERFSLRPSLSWKRHHSIDYDTLNLIVDKGAQNLVNLGVNRPDRVAVVLESPLETYLTFLSVASCAIFCPFNPDYTEREFEHFFGAIDARHLVHNRNLPTVARSVAERLGINLIELTGDEPKEYVFSSKGRQDVIPQIVEPNPADVALILHTSGTTSAPKIVPLTHANLLASASNMAASLSLTGDDCCLNILPPFHVGALVDLLLAPLSSGGSVVVSGDPDPESVFAFLLEFRPTWLQAVPTMLHALLRHRSETVNKCLSGEPPQPLRLLRSVSAPLPDQWLQELEAHFKVPVIEIYGMTETAGLICSNPLDARREGSVGIPAGQQVAIVNAEGNHAATGKVGEVVVDGANVFSGYETSDNTTTVNDNTFIGSWFRTGDEGHIDDDGYLFLTGRIKEIINRGGEKFSPQEVDRIALEHPNVREAGSFGIRHDSLGEDIAMAVVPEQEPLDVKSLQEHLSAKLAYYKVPRKIHTAESLPRNRNGKLLRNQLSRQFDDFSHAAQNPEQWVAPTSELARMIARTWCDVLKVEQVGMNDNFFDLGGDSLSAKGMMTALQKEMGSDIHVTALFEYPTLAEFETRLAETLAEGRISSPAPARGSSADLPTGIHRQLASYLSAWPGQRRHDNSFLIGLNTIGNRPPLFWCGQGFDEIKRLSDVLGPDQPLYGMRSLLKVDGREKDHNRILAQLYLDEIMLTQPEGDLFIGGFCEGGKIAFSIAEEAQKRRRDVGLLCLHDHFVPKSYSGRIAFFFGRPDKDNPYGHYQNPEKGWHQFYNGPASLHRSEMAHDYNDPRLMEFGKHLLHEMDCAMSKTPSKGTIRLDEIANALLPETAYRAEISVEGSIPTMMSPGESLALPVRIRNLSPNPWPPSRESGIVLSSRWFNQHGAPRSLFDGRCTFDAPVLPGESIALPLTITATGKTGSRVLVIDLADEGVTWFQDRGSEPHRASLRVIRGARYLPRILKNSNGRQQMNHG